MINEIKHNGINKYLKNEKKTNPKNKPMFSIKNPPYKKDKRKADNFQYLIFGEYGPSFKKGPWKLS